MTRLTLPIARISHRCCVDPGTGEKLRRKWSSTRASRRPSGSPSPAAPVPTREQRACCGCVSCRTGNGSPSTSATDEPLVVPGGGLWSGSRVLARVTATFPTPSKAGLAKCSGRRSTETSGRATHGRCHWGFAEVGEVSRQVSPRSTARSDRSSLIEVLRGPRRWSAHQRPDAGDAVSAHYASGSSASSPTRSSSLPPIWASKRAGQSDWSTPTRWCRAACWSRRGRRG